MPEDIAPGFETLETTVEDARLPVEGELPAWVSGTLVRNGPGIFETDGVSLDHWFDGFSVLHAFKIEDGEARYACRPLASDAYEHAKEEGQLGTGEFATDPCRSIFQRLFTLFQREGTDNANVNIARLADQAVALTETPMPVVFDPDTLETRGHLEFADELTGHHTTAHPHHDPARGETINYHTRFGRSVTYEIHRLPDGTARRERIARLETDAGSYMHSFALTERYVVLAEVPLVVDPIRFVLDDRPFIEHYDWRPERGTRLRVVDRRTGEQVAAPVGPPVFGFHHVNAYEDDGEIVVDLATYPDAEVIDALYLDRLRHGEAFHPEGALTRFTIDPAADHVEPRTLLDETFELPRIAYDRCNMQPYRYAYGVTIRRGRFLDTLVKVDHETGKTRTWSKAHGFPGEPVFVPAPDADREDDGVLLSVVLDVDTRTSFLLALDAATMTEIARAEAPHAIPFGFHGQFLDG